MVSSRRVLTLLIDNYDSYTYNIYQMLAEVNGIAPIVFRNDDFGGDFSVAWSTFTSEIVAKIKCERMNLYENEEFMLNIVISPGPGTPSVSCDFGMCADALRFAQVPIFGICLGHQGLAHVYGGNVTNAKEVMHGRTSRVFHQEDHEPLFKYIPNGFEVVRYHSLVVTEPLPDDLVVIAKTQDDVIMALKHTKEPKFGVQFHPEAVCSQFGYQIFQNFRDLTLGQAFSSCLLHHGDHKMIKEQILATDTTLKSSRYQVHVTQVPVTIPATLDFAAYVFQHLYGTKQQSFWLDSSNHLPTSHGGSNSRFSFMGDASGPLYQCVEYFVLSNMTRVYTKKSVRVLKETHVLSYLQDQLDQFVDHHQVFYDQNEPLPFEFRGGFVGYLGYETLENGLNNDPNDLSTQSIKEAMTKDPSQSVPDASFLFADRVIVFDHETNHLYLLCVVDTGLITSDSHDEWFRKIEKSLEDLHQVFETTSRQPVSPPPAMFSMQNVRNLVEPVRFYPSRSKKQYMDDIREAQRKIHDGDTYEVCLTNQLTATCQIEDSLAFYSLLRQRNPAPYAGFYRINRMEALANKQDDSLNSYTLCCSSPERFLKVDGNGWIESKPIKGTRRRGQTAQKDSEIAFELANCMKDRAENMMIADLVRNDLGIVCQVGSVHVPKLMHVETYATVHQLVTTVRGQRASRMKNIDIIKATFPGGSMTGAPKKRTMEIIRSLEKIPRGVYSGAMGFFSINNCMDLNIIIRTAVVTPTQVSLGSGGAIVALSDIEEEYDEMLLKTKALVKTIGLYCRGDENQGAIIEIDVCDF